MSIDMHRVPTVSLAPSMRGLAKIGFSEPIFDWGSVA